jgi:glucosamine--fructose-6-phosphate aminotransferase (isomerizing)
MCGIVGYVGRRNSVPVLLEGLQRLEYRGYDSAGVAVVKDRTLRVHKMRGRVRDLESELPRTVTGPIGIGHTRWATHGDPSDRNAHPHTDASGRIAVVHNGILENAAELRRELTEAGVTLTSDTDTEVLAHLIARAGDGDDGDDLEGRVRSALERVTGAYGLAVLDTATPDRLVIACNGSPVVIGVGANEMLVASDVAALVRHTQQVVFLEDGELATLTRDGFTTSTLDRQPVHKVPATLDLDVDSYERGAYATYLRKEIAEQPSAIENALRGRIDARFSTSRLDGLNMTAREVRDVRRVKLLGCGSAYYAGMLGAQLVESMARIPADAEAASEFRYRNPIIDPDTLYVAVSQSGETADTLAAVHEIARKGGRVVGVVNAVGSSIARACTGGVYLHAGPEVSVASTKAFTSSVVVLALLALHLGRVRDLSPADGQRILDGLQALPEQMAQTLEREAQWQDAAAVIAASRSAFYLGRVLGYPVALEGAQKLKELSYVHAEAYPAAELKHGPLALVTPEMPVVIVIPDDPVMSKNVSAIEQVKARGGQVIAVGHRVHDSADHSIVVPAAQPELDPILLGAPLQLLAHQAALDLGRDIDRPRNLAKSVTVE